MDHDELDELLKGGGVLQGLLWAHGTPEGIDPGHLWTTVFPGPRHPVWLWVRSPARRLVVEAEWGVARLHRQFDLGPNGLFIDVASSLPDSPVVVRFSEPTWADFGSGELPGRVPGAEVVSAVSLMERSSAEGPLMDMFSTDLEAKVDAGEPGAVDLYQRVPDAVDSYRRREPVERRIPTQWPPAPEGIEEVERLRFARLRRARRLSRDALAERLASETDIDIGRDTLRRFESDVGQPHDPGAPPGARPPPRGPRQAGGAGAQVGARRWGRAVPGVLAGPVLAVAAQQRGWRHRVAAQGQVVPGAAVPG